MHGLDVRNEILPFLSLLPSCLYVYFNLSWQDVFRSSYFVVFVWHMFTLYHKRNFSPSSRLSNNVLPSQLSSIFFLDYVC